MGLLVSTYMEKPMTQVSFESFRQDYLKNQRPIEAKQTFDKLRRLQKRFEDAFNNPKVYNLVGAIIRVCENKDKFIEWYFGETKRLEVDLERYYKWAFLGLTHKEISESNEEVFGTKFKKCYNALESNELYNENPEEAFRLLLRLNIDEDNKQQNGGGRKFDFSIWDRKDRGRSLEHIYPKSKVLHTEIGSTVSVNGNGDAVQTPDDSYIRREDCCGENGTYQASEHSIGNLVLLYKDDNSAFNDSSFEDKKALFFKIPSNDKEAKAIFKSRHLLHTIYKFAKSTWSGEDIANNKFSTLKEFEEYYGKK